MMKLRTIGGIFAAIATVAAALINSCSEKSSSPSLTLQSSTGNQSPNISNSSSVTINYGVKDCYLDQWAQLMREQGKTSQQIDAKINEINHNLSNLSKQLSGQTTTRIEAERILRYIELGDYRAAEILIKQSSASLERVMPQAAFNNSVDTDKPTATLKLENNTVSFNSFTGFSEITSDVELRGEVTYQRDSAIFQVKLDRKLVSRFDDYSINSGPNVEECAYAYASTKSVKEYYKTKHGIDAFAVVDGQYIASLALPSSKYQCNFNSRLRVVDEKAKTETTFKINWVKR